MTKMKHLIVKLSINQTKDSFYFLDFLVFSTDVFLHGNDIWEQH